MICAYDRVYLESARRNLARMLDFAVYDLEYSLKQFYGWFLDSGIAERFGEGDFTLLAGMSGVELAYEVLDQMQVKYQRKKPVYTMNRSEEYWSGWALAYYQWETSLSFQEIESYIPITEVMGLYTPYHEMDIRQFSDKMNELYAEAKKGTSLQILRKYAGISQRELAELSKTLCCEITDLMEKIEG